MISLAPFKTLFFAKPNLKCDRGVPIPSLKYKCLRVETKGSREFNLKLSPKPTLKRQIHTLKCLQTLVGIGVDVIGRIVHG